MKKVIKFYADPGHGWAAVKTAELFKLGIGHLITGYSYVRGLTTYLEEDCDLTTYVEALKKKYPGIEIDFDIRTTDKSSPIRSYERVMGPS